jgi:hypothetical protein
MYKCSVVVQKASISALSTCKNRSSTILKYFGRNCLPSVYRNDICFRKCTCAFIIDIESKTGAINFICFDVKKFKNELGHTFVRNFSCVCLNLILKKEIFMEICNAYIGYGQIEWNLRKIQIIAPVLNSILWCTCIF